MSVREDIAKKLAVNKGWEYGLLSQPYRNGLLEEVDDLFSLKYDNGQPKIGVIAEDQSKPENIWFIGAYEWQKIQEANFKRIEK